MHNRALENTIYVLAAGAFGVFIRWLQLQLAFDENGLNGPSLFNAIVAAFLIVVAVVLRRRVRRTLGGGWEIPQDFRKALANPGKLYGFFRWLVAGVMILGGLLIIRGSEVEKRVVMHRILGGLAILAGVCFPFWLGAANREELKPRRRGLLCLMALAPILLFAVWLVFDYMENSINSVVWAFLVEVVTCSALMLAFFRLGGFIYGQVDMKKTLFWIQFGAFMSLVALADERGMGMQMVFLAAGLMLTLADFILLRKLREKVDMEEKPPVSDGGIEQL